MADRMFDLNQLEDEAKAQAEAAAGIETAAGRTLRHCTNDRADAAHPILTLADPERKLPHHALGVFLNPVRGTAFAWTDGKTEANVSGRDKDGRDLSVPIASIDQRFVALEHWLGENHVSLRLSGAHTEEGYAVYRIRAMAADGERIQTERDEFLQLVIRRLLESRAPEEKSDAEAAFDAEEREGKNPGATPISDLNSMLNYLACAVPCTTCAPALLTDAAVSVVVAVSAPLFWTLAAADAASGPSSVISTKVLLSASAVVDRLVALSAAIRSPATIRFL